MSCALYINLDVSADYTDCVMYYEWLKKEIINHISPIPVTIIYIKLGATRVTPLLMLDISGILKNKFTMQQIKEVTIEIAYPGITVRELLLLDSIGFNRINISYTQENGSVDDLACYINELQPMYTTISLDVKIGMSNSKWSVWKAFFEYITQLAIVHCTIETDRSDVFASYLSAIRSLFESAGFEQYELIHFARFGYESHYMNHFWNRDTLYGFGLGAYSCVNDMRIENESELHYYCQSMASQGSAAKVTQQLTPQEKADEEILLTIRKNRGIEVTSIKKKLSTNAFTRFMSMVNILVLQGLLWHKNDRIVLTHKGQRVEQSIVQALLS